jgi:hypothetical protein
MLDKAFGLKQVTEEVSQDPMVGIAASMVMYAETEEDRQIALNIFGQTLTGLMAYGMSQLLLSEQDFSDLTATINELVSIQENGEDN